MDELERAQLPQEVYTRKESLPMLYRPAVLILGGVGAVCVLGMIGLAAFDRAVSEGLIAIASVAVGALANMVAQDGRTDGN
jgi:hypothetical protein